MNCCPPNSVAPSCPVTGTPTMPVAVVTVRQHAVLAELPDTSFGFCEVPTCTVVYVGADGTLIEKSHVRTRVGIKETEDPIPVCYCFEFTAAQIADDLLTSGQSTIRGYIQDQVQAGRCRCEVTNPSGRCCLANVGHVIRAASKT